MSDQHLEPIDDIERLFDEDPARVVEQDLNHPPTDAVVTSSDWTTETIFSQIEKGNIDLNPRFQRREAWNDKRKSVFIESLFLGLPVPQLVLAEKPAHRGTYIVVDGKQRLLAIRRFGATERDDRFSPLRLSGLEVRPDLNGKDLESMRPESRLSELVSWYENQTIRTVVVRNWNREEFLYRVFLRLNMGTLPLSSQELRQALHPGPFVDFADEQSSNSDAIQRALHLDKPDFRMRDIEILVRFFGFRERLEEYNGDLKAFLDQTCDTLNRDWDLRSTELEAAAGQCDLAINATLDIFGRGAFRRWDTSRYVGPFNRAVFDVMVYFFSRGDVRCAAVQKREEIVHSFKRLCDSNSAFRDAIQTTTKSIRSTFTRLQEWRTVLRRITGLEIEAPPLDRAA
jgi:hypothetical protein